MSTFWEASSWTRTAAGVYGWEVDPTWAQGRGIFGGLQGAAVVRAMEREVAIKVLLYEFGEDITFIESFTPEAKAMARLDHSNLLRVFDYGNISASAKPVAGVRWTTTNRQIDFVWDHSSTRWLRFQDGVPLLDASGMQLGADNVVLLYVFYTQSAADPRSPEAISIGSGGGKLFRQGTERTITWDRPIASDGWHLADPLGRNVATLTPGTTWVGLLKAGEMRLLTATEVAVLTG